MLSWRCMREIPAICEIFRPVRLPQSRCILQLVFVCFQLEELIKEVRVLKAELRTRDKTIAQLTFQLQQQQQQQERPVSWRRQHPCQRKVRIGQRLPYSGKYCNMKYRKRDNGIRRSAASRLGLFPHEYVNKNVDRTRWGKPVTLSLL